MDELLRIGRCWLQPDELSAQEVTERVVMDWSLQVLPTEKQKAIWLKGPSNPK